MLIITGTGRSGTGMLARLLGGHHEFRATYLLDRCRSGAYGQPPLSSFEARLQAVFDIHRGVKPETFMDASNLYTMLLDALWAAYPDARFVLGVRNGRDFCRSAMARGWHSRESFDVLPEPGTPLAKVWPQMGPVARTASIWTRRNAQALDFLERLPEDRWMMIRIEEMDDAGLDRLALFSGHPIVDRAAVGARINARFHPEPPGWAAADEAIFIETAGPMMRRLGYA